MKLTVQKLMDATLVLAQIIRDRRPLPQKGSYRLARMHSKLLPEFTTINSKRDEIITAYNYHPVSGRNPDGEDVFDENFAVPAGNMDEFTAAWKEIGDEEIEVDVQPIPLSQLDLGDSVEGSISAGELITLGDLVTE